MHEDDAQVKKLTSQTDDHISYVSEEENADDEVRRLNKEMEVQSHLSDSTVTVDIDHVSNDSKKIDSEGINQHAVQVIK